MEIRAQLMTDLKEAMKQKNAVKLDTIRFLQSAIKYREIELRPETISNDEVMGVVKKLVKQRRESIEQYAAGNRQDLVDKETAELKILEAYLPAQMSREQIEQAVVEVIAALKATTIKDMGAVIKEAQARTKGAADNKMLSEIVRSKLA